jgi:hypothetical protein
MRVLPAPTDSKGKEDGKKMKAISKLLSLSVTAALAITLAACGGSPASSGGNASSDSSSNTSTTAAAAQAKRQRRPNTDQRNTLKIGRIANVVPRTAW